MNEPFAYSEAPLCGACDERAIISTRELADRFVEKSEGRLKPIPCTIGNGWHLAYPAAELAHL
ncbi:hypothetical protein [Amycolatopsis sp. H20-H5]|uniref:hypothetical protein n=1 Tax=Amycolatopsis sp. H20-H5 TaxID=3046309 RepID=UPI002DBDA36F|nr:hypothetical protein [Amycolatopsis sp. H20-H5]MEC3976162.1 hypothetical protein [Amycolatopsis sp. H20-H5]